jgi:hypothetical protein
MLFWRMWIEQKATSGMMKQQEMQNDIAYWVEEVGYEGVLDALIATCQYWATSGDIPPIEGPSDLWIKRERALRHAQWEASI